MKRIVVASVACLLVVAGMSCKKVIKAIFPGINVKLADVTLQVPVPPIFLSGEVNLGNFTQKFNLDSIVKVNTGGTFTVDDITSVKVKEITLTILNPDQFNNLSNFDYVRLGISSNTVSEVKTITTINFPDTYAATITNVPTESYNILAYAKGTEIYYNVAGKMRKPTTKTLTVVVSTTVSVE